MKLVSDFSIAEALFLILHGFGGQFLDFDHGIPVTKSCTGDIKLSEAFVMF